MSYTVKLAIAAVFLAVGRVIWAMTRGRKGLPPGPPQLPIIGNLHQAPIDYPWRTYQEWTKQYGPVYYLQYGLNTIIMLGTHQAARDLLDKRSNIYSDRPHVPMGGDIVSKGLRTLLMPYGSQWRAHQRVQSSFTNIRTSQTYRELQDMESKQLIFEMLSTSNFTDRYHRYSSSLLFTLAYGKRLVHGDEPEAKAIDQIMENFLYAGRVGTWIVDALPALNYLPAFLAPWKRYGNELHRFEADNYTTFMAEGLKTKSWNFSKQVKEVPESKGMSPLEQAYDVGITYEAGSDTTTMALEIFTLAAVLYPDVVRKAQEEIDSVVGANRLPKFDDQPNLPYVMAILKEVLRWRPVTAGGIPHAVIQDDEYMGFKIPKGATVIPNHWAIHLDEAVYKDPYKFNPDRWIENPDLPLAAFGFGRRVCIGQHIARNSLFINMARLLWAFNIEYVYEEVNGVKVKQEIDPMAFTQGFNSRPQPFKADFQVRSSHAEDIVKGEWAAAEKDPDVIMDRIRAAQKTRG